MTLLFMPRWPLRTGLSHLSAACRYTTSFSKKLAHHIGAIKYVICHYNLTRAVALPV
jgi:hypothetical protein